MKQSFTEFWRFLKSPTFKISTPNQESNWTDFFSLFLLNILFTIPLVSLFYLFIFFKLIKEHDGWDLFKEFGVYWGFAIGCLFAPLLEEYLFRWQLTKRYASIYFLMLSMATMIILNTESDIISWVVFFSALAVAITLHMLLKKRSQTFTFNLWRTWYPILFYLTALIFGLIHLSNYDGLTATDPSIIFYIGSQIFGGLILGYIRIKHGIGYSILFHACFNLIALSLELFFG